MALVTKNDVTQIFAIQAPSIDLPPTFANYPRGWDTARTNNGKPTIKQFNYIQQRTDQNVLWIHQNGAALPYDAAMEYAENAHVVKDGELQKKQGASWVSATNKGYNLDYFVSGKSYPLHAEIMLDNGDIVKSTIPNNTNDPNVNMTGWSFESKRNVSSISEMLLIQNQIDGQSVFVDGLQGGSFTYNKSKELINDGGTVFSGWVRIHFLTENLVEWFGAKWDGTDTTEALDKAIIESAKQKRVLNFGGAERTYTVNTMRHTAGFQASSWLLLDDMHLLGSGCKIIADNRFTNMPDTGHEWYYRFFTLEYPMVSPKNNISIIGIDFDTQFDKYSDAKHKIAVLITSNGILNNFLMQHCDIYNASGTNAVGCFSDHLQTEIHKNWKILDCRFINNGSGGGDYSAIYLMCDDAEVKVDVLQHFNDPIKNMHCSNAIEIHGSNHNVHHCLIDKVAGGIIAGINYIEPVYGTKINSNIINTYSGGVTVWSGEDFNDKGHKDISIGGNTVRVLPYLKTGSRKGIGVGGFGNSVTDLIVNMNTVICEDAVDAENLSTPIHFDFTTGGIGFALVNLLNIVGNTTRGGQGITVLSNIQNMTYKDIVIRGNTITLDHATAGITNIGVRVSLPAWATVLNNATTNISGNTVLTTNALKSSAIAYYFSGFINQLTASNTASIGVQKYYFANEPATFVDCENFNEPTNISPTLKYQTDNELRFEVDLVALRNAATATSAILCSLPPRTVIKSVFLVDRTSVTGATNPLINIGSQTTSQAFLKNIPVQYEALGGFGEADRGSLLTNKVGAYLANIENIVFNLSADTALSTITGTIGIIVKFESV